MSFWLMFVLGAAVLPRAEVPTETQQTVCEVSSLWAEVDESQLDLIEPTGTVRATLSTGCHFIGPPGARVTLLSEGRRVATSVEVVSMRRLRGQVQVALSPERAEAVGRLDGPVTKAMWNSACSNVS